LYVAMATVSASADGRAGSAPTTDPHSAQRRRLVALFDGQRGSWCRLLYIRARRWGAAAAGGGGAAARSATLPRLGLPAIAAVGNASEVAGRSDFRRSRRRPRSGSLRPRACSGFRFELRLRLDRGLPRCQRQLNRRDSVVEPRRASGRCGSAVSERDQIATAVAATVARARQPYASTTRARGGGVDLTRAARPGTADSRRHAQRRRRAADIVPSTNAAAVSGSGAAVGSAARRRCREAGRPSISSY
jgi:hypothetical protein